MESIDELTRDCKELQSLLKSAVRLHVRELLAAEISVLQGKINNLQDKLKKKQENAAENSSGEKGEKPHVFTKKIQTYGWDQTDKLMKIYVQLAGIENVPKENIKLDVKSKSFSLLVCNLNKMNHNLSMPNLLEEVDPTSSFFRVKSGNVIVTLKKKVPQNWSHLTGTEKKIKEDKTPKLDKDEDPSAGIMKMMKQMYDDGDDEMKRTISKAWTESREKQASGQNPLNF